MPVMELRSWPASFDEIWRGAKTYDLRRADRPFVVGLQIKLREWDPRREVNDRYTGRALLVEVVHVTEPDSWGLPGELCVLGLRVLARSGGAPRVGPRPRMSGSPANYDRHDDADAD